MHEVQYRFILTLNAYVRKCKPKTEHYLKLSAVDFWLVKNFS